ncbi:hypothetical protein ILYODFUR_001077 [Ilyodon furcidens]|uniref:BED-type domain-containing protein n=1 Tax=Ilyodon furcidens TaxID=33524 RepID=A0ABV0U2T5_9TELE
MWDHFKLNRKENTVQCMDCETELAFCNNTSSMLKHLSRKHPLQQRTPPHQQRRSMFIINSHLKSSPARRILLTKHIRKLQMSAERDPLMCEETESEVWYIKSSLYYS